MEEGDIFPAILGEASQSVKKDQVAMRYFTFTRNDFSGFQVRRVIWQRCFRTHTALDLFGHRAEAIVEDDAR